MAGFVLLAVGGAVVATSAVLFVLDAQDAEPGPPGDAAVWGPLVVPGGGGVVWAVTF